MKGSVIVVDDEQIILKSCKKILSSEGYEVDTFTSAIEALAILHTKQYDLIITDLKMPGMDGIEFIKHVRQTNPDINILVITGYPSQESIKEALSLRIIDYLPKPFTPSIFLDVVAKAMELKKKGVTPQSDVEEVSDEISINIDEIINKYKNKRGALISALLETQDIVGYLPPIVQKHVAKGLKLPVSEVNSVVSFYSFFSVKPRGKHNIKVCLGTACYVKGAEAIVKQFSDGLAIDVGNVTADRKYSLETVRCLGACGLAPVVVVDKDTHGSVNPVSAMELLKEYQ